LRQAGRGPCLNQRPREVELLTQGVAHCLVSGVLSPAAMQIADLRQGFNSFALCSASSIPAGGVFSVFLMEALTITTRCSFAVT
jgi:hypothetical protein